MELEEEDVESNPSLAVALFDQYKVEISALEKELDEKEEELEDMDWDLDNVKEELDQKEQEIADWETPWDLGNGWE